MKKENTNFQVNQQQPIRQIQSQQQQIPQQNYQFIQPMQPLNVQLNANSLYPSYPIDYSNSNQFMTLIVNPNNYNIQESANYNMQNNQSKEEAKDDDNKSPDSSNNHHQFDNE